jgi:hypothetical protein
MHPSQASDGAILPEPKRFPNGIKPLSDWIHSHGFKFGIYTDIGNTTCGGVRCSISIAIFVGASDVLLDRMSVELLGCTPFSHDSEMRYFLLNYDVVHITLKGAGILGHEEVDALTYARAGGWI